MTTKTNCGVTTGADVKMYYLIDDCGCPGEAPVAPFTIQELNAGTRSFTETRETVEAPNAYDKTCTKSFTSGGEATNAYDLCFGSNQNLMDAAIGGGQTLAPEVTDTMDVIDTETYQSTTFDFETLGFVEGMTVDVTGFADPANNGQKVICEIDGMTIKVVACEGDEVNPELVPEAGATATMQAFFVSYSGNQQSNIAVFRHFPETFNSLTDTTGLVQVGYGGVITSSSLSITPGEFVTGSYTIATGAYERCTELDLPIVKEDDCECERKVFVDPRNIGAVEFFYGCQPICVTTFEWTLDRPLDTKTTTCGVQQTAGKPTVTFTFETALEDSAYLCNLDGCDSDGGANPLTVRIRDIDPCTGEVAGFISYVFPNVSLDAVDIDPDADTCLTQTITGTAQTYGPIDAPFFVQRSEKNEEACRNRVEFSVTGTEGDFAVRLPCAGEEIIVDWGDGTVETFLSTGVNQAFTHTYAVAGDYDVVATAPEATCGIDVVILNAAQNLESYNLCYVSNSLEQINLLGQAGFDGLENPDFSNLPCLETLTANFNALTDANIEGSCALTQINLRANALPLEVITKLVCDLVDCGRFDGVLELDGGTNAAPDTIAQAKIDELVARGWTVTTN